MRIKNYVCSFHRRVMDRDNQNAMIRLVRGFLWPFSILYGRLAGLRNWAYNYGLKSAVQVDVPVISVGNITVGGTGKTPFVVWLCEQLRRAGREPAILSRGYGKDASSGVDDENEMLGALVQDVPVVVNPDRVEGAKTAVQREGADVLVMDDGFQHRRLARDCDIVLVDALNPFGGGRAIPLGTLREPLSGLSRAHVLVITRSDQVKRNRLERLIETLQGYTGTVPVAIARHAPSGMYEMGRAADDAVVADLDALREKRWGAFCGIGNPAAFRRTLEGMGV
ncbi:MAG: tetraacyldisaccharide 4'-kinase, partial [Planctomycetota bacterium]